MTCPLCGNEGSTHEIVKAGEARIIACRICTNAWSDPPPAGKSYDSDDFHGRFNYIDMEDLPKQWRNGLIKQIKIIRRFLLPGSRLLEIGCGQGLLLEALKKDGYKVAGIEPSVSGSKKAAEKGLDVINDYFPSNRIEGQKFDLVILSQVLEHINNLHFFLNHLAAALTKNGKILFVQTNWKGLMPRYFKSRWYAWVPDQHYWHFTPKGLAIILERKGFQVEKVEYYSLEHNNHLLSRLASIVPTLADQFHMIVKYEYHQ